MANAEQTTRATGATALMRPRQQPEIQSATGAAVGLSNHVRAPGFSPVDLLYGALAGCIALSARAAAAELGMLDQLQDVRVGVSGRKAADGPSRIESFAVEIVIDGDFNEETRRLIAERAEGEICTVSNTLRGRPTIEMSVRPA